MIYYFHQIIDDKPMLRLTTSTLDLTINVSMFQCGFLIPNQR